MRLQKVVVAFIVTMSTAVSLPAEPLSRMFTPERMVDIVGFVPGSEPVISPDGSMLAFATSDRSLESNILSSHPDGFLWIQRGSDKPTRISGEGYADTPVWSPDGRQLAFFRTKRGLRRLCIWTVASRDVREIGDEFPKDKSLSSSTRLAPQWSANGSVIVYPILLPAPAQTEPETQLLHSTDAAMPFDTPFVDTRKWSLVAIDVAKGQAHTLTTQASLSFFSISPDSSKVLYRAVTPETQMLFRHERSQDWFVPIDGSQPAKAVLKGRTPTWVIFSANGGNLLFPENGKLRSINVDGGDEKVILEKFPQRTSAPRLSSGNSLAFLSARSGTGPADPKMYSILEPISDVVVLRLPDGQMQMLTTGKDDTQNDDLVWSRDGSALFYHSIDEGSYQESLYRWRPTSIGAEKLYSADQEIRTLSTSLDGATVSFLAMSAIAPEECYELQKSGLAPLRMTDLNPSLAEFKFQAPLMFEFYSADGDPLKALLYLPAGSDATHPVPVVTYIYEKLSEYKNKFDPEAQWYVSHGFGYLMPDVLIKVPHPTDSYLKSVIPAVNAVRAMGVTTGRFGITGGSLGGFAGLSLITHTDIFAAAVLRAPPSDFFSTWGDGRDRDLWTIEAGQGRMAGTPWNSRDTYIENSPFLQADQVHTPVLIVHGEADFTVPFQQGLMMFTALRALHRTADLLIYRDGEHSIVRGSRFRYIDFHSHTMEWWDRYLRINNVTSTQTVQTQ
jgi:dipeptidyl aminopeptidase/acylaminoacyl peptidase